MSFGHNNYGGMRAGSRGISPDLIITNYDKRLLRIFSRGPRMAWHHYLFIALKKLRKRQEASQSGLQSVHVHDYDTL